MTNAESNFELAVKFIKGEGVEKDVDKATALLTEAAAAGHIKAQYNLGVMYLNGIGTGKDIDKATDCFKQAANQGHEQARHALEKICKTLSITEIQTPIEAGVSPNPHEKLNECLACQSCNKYNLLTAKFCVNCGVKLQDNSKSITRKPSNKRANADTTSETTPIVITSNTTGGSAPAQPNVAQAPETSSPVTHYEIEANVQSSKEKITIGGLGVVGHRNFGIIGALIGLVVAVYFNSSSVDLTQLNNKWRCQKWIDGDLTDQIINYQFRDGSYMWEVSKGYGANLLAIPGRYTLDGNHIEMTSYNYTILADGSKGRANSNAQKGEITKLTKDTLKMTLDSGFKMKFECSKF